MTARGPALVGCAGVLVGLTWVLSGCPFLGQEEPGTGDKSKVLHYFTWSDYVSQDLIAEFERQEGAKVVVDTFSSNEELLAKLQTGASGYDVAVPSDFMVAIMIRLGLLAELSMHRLPNLELVEPHLQNLPFDLQHRYSIPYLWGTVGIGYDAALFPVPPDSWAVLWDSRYRGRISMLNDQREVFGAVFRLMGVSLNQVDPLAIERAKDKLIVQKPLVKAYTSDHYDQLLAAGEVVLAHGWVGPMVRARAERPSIRYTVPREGGTIWADCLVVLRSSRQQDLAHRFINFLLETRVSALTAERLFFAPANRLAKEQVRPDLRQDTGVFPALSLLRGLEWMTDVGEAIRLYDRAWTELKMT
jgi:spermidine/putrescine-binding protein